MKYRRPRYMNGGGIASLMSNGGSEAMMLELEGDAAALPGDLFSDEPDPRWLSHPEDEGYLPEAQIRRQLQRKAGSQIGEWLEDLTGMFDMQEAYDEELGILDPADPFSSLTPELMEEIGEMIMPGGGMVKMGKGGLGLLGKFFNRMRRGKSKPTDVGEEELAKIRQNMNMPKYNKETDSSGADAILGTYRSTDVPKPPNLRSGGALSYKKGYYGKSYK